MLDLRPVQLGDAPALHALMSDPEVARWLRPSGISGPFTREECETMAARDAARACRFKLMVRSSASPN